MTSNLSTEEIATWKKATAICKQLSGLTPTEIKIKLDELQPSSEVKALVISILEKQFINTQLFDDSSGQNLLSTVGSSEHIPGDEFGGYKLKSLIAQGGMSSVYLAEHVESGVKKDVAIKLLSPYCTTDKSIELFLREQQILSKLYHPNIVSFHHSGQTKDGTHYLVMEHIEGGQKITDYCQANHYSHNEIIDLIINLCEIFAYTHEQQVIHRDIKPSNILIDLTGQPKVIDFGIGRFDVLNDKTSTHVFTLEAASPEQITGQSITSQTDVFSLGALMLELLSQTQPLPKTNIQNYDPQDDVNHINRTIKGAGLDKDLGNIIRKAMHIEVNRRYPTMAEFKSDLVNWRNHLPVSAAGDTAFYRIKKYVQRNLILSFSLAVVALTAMGSIFYIHHTNVEKTAIKVQRANSLALVDAMFKQMDPQKNDGRGKNQALIDFFQKPSNELTAVIQSDPEIEYFYFEKLSALYQNLSEFELALTATIQAQDALKKYSDTNHPTYLGLELKKLHIMQALGDNQYVINQHPALLAKINDQKPKHLNLMLSHHLLLNKAHSDLSQYDEALKNTQLIEQMIIEHQMHGNDEVDKKLLSKVHNSMAVVWRQNGQSDLAESHYLKSIDLILDVPNSENLISTIYSNLAILKGRNGLYDESEHYFQKAIDLHIAIDEANLQLATTYVSYATLKRVTGKIDEAQVAIKQAIGIYEKYDDKIRLGEAYFRLMGLSMTNMDLHTAITQAQISFDHFLSENQSLSPVLIDTVAQTNWFYFFDEFNNHKIEFTNTFDPFVAQYNQRSSAQLYLFQKHILGIDSVNIAALSPSQQLFIQYKDQLTNLTDEEKIRWLNSKLSSYEGSKDIVHDWLLAELSILTADQSMLIQLCQTNQKWMNSSWFYFKYAMIKKCLDHAHMLDTNTRLHMQSFHNQVVTTISNQEESILNTLKVITNSAKKRINYP